MDNDKKYQLCISLQQQLLNELREEFSVSTVNRQFPSCVSYQNGEYIYDLDVIRVIFAYYFKENFISLKTSLDNSAGAFVRNTIKGMIHAKRNIENIRLQKKFREEFLKKSKEIKIKYFDNPDENDKNNLRVKIKEYNECLNCVDYEDFDVEDIFDALKDTIANFKEDLRKLKKIKDEVYKKT